MKRVIIVGGGVIGLWCAVRLRQGGAQVTLLEAESEFFSPYGPTASAAAAGMLAAVEARASKHEQVGLSSFDMWRDGQQGAEWADGVRFDGVVVICENSDQAAQLHANAQRLGRSAALLNSAQFQKRTGLDAKVDTGVFIADEAVADPIRVLSGLSMQARALGAILMFDTDVAEINGPEVIAHNGRVLQADVIVLAPGAWATDALKSVAPALQRVAPGKGQVVVVETARPLGATVRGPGFYLARRREDTVLGATMEMGRTDRRPDPEKGAALLERARGVLADELRPTARSWAGIRPMSPDGFPMIGRSADVLVAAGHGRNGWLFAPVTAEIISAYVFGSEIPPEWAALSPQRFDGP